MLTLKTITIGELGDFIQSDEFKKAPVIPITSQRATSYIKNPRADAADVVLILAYSNDTMCGYLGVLPDYYLINDTSNKIGWMSCIWVDDAKRGEGIAEKMINKAFEVWVGNILATEFTPAAKHLYDKTEKFNEFTTLYGIRAYLRMNMHQLLPPKKESFRKAAPILKVSDGAVNILNDIRLKFAKPDQPYSIINKLDEVVINFINQHNQQEAFRRDAEDLKWIKDFPWLKVGKTKDAEAERYHFSAVTPQFYNRLIQINDHGERVGVALVQVRDQNLKLPYIYFDKENTEAVAKGILHLMVDHKLNMLTTYNPFLSEYILCNPSPFFKVRPFIREYLISKKVQDLPEEIILQDGDGDCAFT